MNDLEESIIKELLTGYKSQNQLAETLQVNQSTISRRLASLRLQGLVKPRSNAGFELNGSPREVITHIVEGYTGKAREWMKCLE